MPHPRHRTVTVPRPVRRPRRIVHPRSRWWLGGFQVVVGVRGGGWGDGQIAPRALEFGTGVEAAVVRGGWHRLERAAGLLAGGDRGRDVVGCTGGGGLVGVGDVGWAGGEEVHSVDAAAATTLAALVELAVLASGGPLVLALLTSVLATTAAVLTVGPTNRTSTGPASLCAASTTPASNVLPSLRPQRPATHRRVDRPKDLLDKPFQVRRRSRHPCVFGDLFPVPIGIHRRVTGHVGVGHQGSILWGVVGHHTFHLDVPVRAVGCTGTGFERGPFGGERPAMATPGSAEEDEVVGGRGGPEGFGGGGRGGGGCRERWGH